MTVPPPTCSVVDDRTRRRLRADRRARVVVGFGGVAIVACILGIVLFLVIEAAPLASGAQVSEGRQFPVALPAGAAVIDDLASHLVCASPSGTIEALRLEDSAVVARGSLLPAGASGPLTGLQADTPAGYLAGAGGDGRVHVVAVRWESQYETSQRTSVPILEPLRSFALDPEGRMLQSWAVSRSVERELAAAGQTAGGTIVVVRSRTLRNEFTGEQEVEETRHVATAPVAMRLLCLDRAQTNLYGCSVTGRLFWWRLTGSGIDAPLITVGPAGDASAMRLLLGDQSLILGTREGTISQWSPVRDAGVIGLRSVREFPALAGEVRALAMSARSKAFAALSDQGVLALCFATSGDQRWTSVSPLANTRALTLSPRGDRLVAVGPGEAVQYVVDDPHPEASFTSLFLPVWYENYDQPGLTWQSTPSTDGGEPKLSLTPLLWGTLKATLACLLVSVPIALLAALFLSQFVHPRLRAWLKPTVELMAALPSVVLGFVAAVWLAPHLERVFLGLALAAVVAPAVAALGGGLAARVPAAWRARWLPGSELLPICAIVLVTVTACVTLTPALESLLFGCGFPEWVRNVLGLDYDQKNAAVVAMAMAIAVIPIVFSISEESFHNVPRTLVSASLALGANRWETAVRVVVPAASPGLFSAVMVGFGRAIGETMIVLMAVGATPIMDVNLFTGFRTLSANIAIEIPEAPHGGTLYRVLFLSALLLFALTFVLNSAAEVVRTRLRRRYASI